MSDQLNTFAEAVAVALGPEWAVKPNEWATNVDLHDDQGRVINLHWWPQATKVTVSGGYYPDDRSRIASKVKRPKIGVSIARDPVKVAADIRRRFLAEYDNTVNAIMREVEKEAHAENQRRDATTVIAGILGAKTSPQSLQGAAAEPTAVRGAAGYGHFSVRYQGEAWDISLHTVPHHVAERLAEVLADELAKVRTSK